jgi:hypothetical protein
MRRTTYPEATLDRRLATAAGLLWVVAIGALLVGCSRAPAPAPAPEAPLPALLSETGLYADPAARTVDSRNRPFAPQYPLWTDGAAKRRWIRLPEGAAIDGSDADAWVFPVGTRLWKEFSFGRAVETRYMERRADGSWAFASYAWDADGKDARLVPAGGLARAHALPSGAFHAVPSRSDCLTCHGDRKTPVLGFSALQLSTDRDPRAPHAEPPPPDALDLAGLLASGRLAHAPAHLAKTPPRIAAASPRARAARGYLHANCGSCHGANRALVHLGLSFEESVAQVAGPVPALETTLGVPSRFRFADPAGRTPLRVDAEHPDLSVVLRRAATRSPLAQMPPLGTRLVDEEAVSLLSEWLREEVAPAVPPTKESSR